MVSNRNPFLTKGLPPKPPAFDPAVGNKWDTGKLPYHLLPNEALAEVVKVLHFGAIKYSERNWEKGINYSRVFSAAMRHLWSWWGGEDRDPETGLSHLAHLVCCGLFILQFVTLNDKYKEFDDRP